MNREDIIKLARKADIEWDLLDEEEGQIWYITKADLERFAALVAASEREACAKVCEELHIWPQQKEMQIATIEDCAAAIRARGNT